MANVYLARDMILERDVAIKVLRFDFSNDEEFIKRFRREAHSATSLTHPNIVSIYDVGEEDGIYYIVMEYVAGKTLKQYIQQNAPLQVRVALDIMEQLTSAMAHAHQNQIVHRDIKPHNILIDPDGLVKVTDFGIAVALSSTTITHTNSVLGSVHYLSPEQARGGMATKKSDIYALGIVMFELLTGRLPFSGESAVSIALKHLQSETPSPKMWNSLIPQSVENIILKATAKDPFYRYDSAEAMKEDILTATSPERVNEEKFFIPDDNEATKAIPIIKDETIGQTEDTVAIPAKPAEPKKNAGAEDKDLPKQGKKKKGRLALFLTITFILLTIAAVAAVTIVPRLFLPKDVEVPDVSELDYEAAVSSLTDKGFKISKDTVKQEHESIPEGDVIRTDPQANEVVKEGAKVLLYVSTGKRKLEIGDYEGRPFEDVESELKGQNFKDIETEAREDESEPGTILEQSISPGEMVVADETEISFVISKGPPKINLRKLTDYNETSVRDYLEENELYPLITYEYSDTVKEGLVIRQDPAPDSKLDKGATVSVVISKGVKEKPAKEVYKEIEIPYDSPVEGEIQQVQIFVEDAEHSSNQLYKPPFDITGPKKEKIKLIIPFNGSAKIKVLVDEKLVLSETYPYEE